MVVATDTLLQLMDPDDNGTDFASLDWSTELGDRDVVLGLAVPAPLSTDGRYTACISSQVGCAQACVFCATGQQGFTRQLTASEIFEQVATFSALLQSSGPDHHPDNDNGSTTNNNNRNSNKVTHGRSKRLSNVVFMGMGEVRLLFQSSVNPRVNQTYIGLFSHTFMSSLPFLTEICGR